MKLFLALMLATGLAQAETFISPQAAYHIERLGYTTYVTTTSQTPSTSSTPTTATATAVAVGVPVAVNPITGIGQIITSDGTYIVSRQGNTTSVIQTSKSK